MTTTATEFWATGGRTDMPNPPFFRGERGEWEANWCDRLLASGDACDDPVEYLVEWIPMEGDGGTIPVSGACVLHGLDVDRRLVTRMTLHPARTR